MKKLGNLPLICNLYINYLFQGIAALVISQNLVAFQEAWQASQGQAQSVASAIGLGRILSLYLAGYVSDKFGRRITVFIGAIAYILFFAGLPLVNQISLAFAITLLAGVGNAFLDTGIYPIVVETFTSGQDNSALSVLNKAFISVGQFILPLITYWMISFNIHYIWLFVFCALILAVNLAITNLFQFGYKADLAQQEERGEGKQEKMGLVGSLLLFFSFVSVSLFNIFAMWVPTFAQETLGMARKDSLLFVSVYSLCSFISVFCTFYIVKKGTSLTKMIVFCLALCTLSQLLMVLLPSYLTIMLGSVIIGVFSAGGIWQLGLMLLLKWHSHGKGMVTGYYSFATAISVMATPYITSVMADQSIYLVFWYNALLAGLGALALYWIHQTFKKIY